MPQDFAWDVDLVVMQLLKDLGIPVDHSIRLYNQLLLRFDDLIAATASGGTWPLQLIDRAYARWPGLAGMFSLGLGQVVDGFLNPDIRPVESIAYDLAELARRKKKGGRHGTGDEGDGKASGVR